MTTPNNNSDSAASEEKSQTRKEKSLSKDESKTVSRRNFMKSTALAGAGAAVMLQAEHSDAQEADKTDIRIPE